jgi:autoinducer 2-degrading protein
MHLTIVHVHVKQEHVADFIAATKANHEGSTKEEGNLRFDVLQSERDPSRFVLYEVYASTETAAAHKNTPHYLEWRETVAAWMASPREGKPYRVVAPRDPSRW